MGFFSCLVFLWTTQRSLKAETTRKTRMIEVTCNDRLGKKIRVKCLPTDTVEDFKKILSLQIGTSYDKIILKKGYTIFKNHITLEDYEINDGMNLELYYS